MKILRVSLISIVMVLFLAGSVFAQQCGRVALNEAADIINLVDLDPEVTLTKIEGVTWLGTNQDYPYYYEFKPEGVTPQDGFIIYTGGDVDIAAYAVTAREIARAGFFVALVPSPLCYASLGKMRADAVIANNLSIETWSIGGHSFGGVAAGMYVQDKEDIFEHEDKIKGLILWASYPAESIADKPIEVISLWGTQDSIVTELDDIIPNKSKLPADTFYVELTGANHTQFGWYGENATDYEYLTVSNGVTDYVADITREEQDDLIVAYTVNFLESLTPDTNIPDALDYEVANEDGSVWEQVSLPGFDSLNNISVVAMAEYQGRLYAMTRNQTEGAEVWRTNGASWEQVLFPGGETNGVYGNTILNNVWARMIEFQGKLYFGFSSGLQGNFLGSSGCEIWTYDGVMWNPVISDKKDIDEEGSITGFAGCAAADGNTTASITDSTKTWVVNQWAGATLQIVSGSGTNRKFNIISNTVDTLTVQQDETAGTGADAASESEFTVCTEASYNNPYPKYSYTLGALIVGDTYEIGVGNDENGFGDYWNKTITDMVLFDDKLYVSTGLNYAHGAQIWFTADGDNWTATQAATGNGSLTNSYGNYHADPLYPNGLKAVSSSLTNMAVFDDVLYAGGTGTGGEQGSCSRMAQMTEAGWVLIVDGAIDINTTGTNENGFGDGMECDMNTGNFMPWSIESFNDKLMVAINSLGGVRMLYSEYPTGDDLDIFDDSTWKYSVGGDSGLLPGFNGLANNPPWGYDNIAANLFEFNNEMYAGVVTMYIPEYNAINTYGAPIWKTSDGITWTPITTDGFDDPDVIIAEAFTDFGGTLYVAASKGASSTPQGTGGAKVYRLAAECEDGPEGNIICGVGSVCAEGACALDDPPTIGSGPFLAAGYWPVLPTDSDSPIVLTKNYSVYWNFSDDYATCDVGDEDCIHTVEYQAEGEDTWTALDDVIPDGTGRLYVKADLPINQLQNATTYALRYTVEDCAEQETVSGLYYFRVIHDDDGDGYSVDEDCDDSNADIYQLLEGSVDADLDGHVVGSMLQICSGESLPEGYSYSDGEEDCDDSNADIYQLLEGYLDVDGDGLNGSVISVCSGSKLPEEYNTWDQGGSDNCPLVPNSWRGGTCYNYATQQSGGSCMLNAECQDSPSEWYKWCDKTQIDIDGNGIGDVCE